MQDSVMYGARSRDVTYPLVTQDAKLESDWVLPSSSRQPSDNNGWPCRSLLGCQRNISVAVADTATVECECISCKPAKRELGLEVYVAATVSCL
jgi:hypothetical protein